MELENQQQGVLLSLIIRYNPELNVRVIDLNCPADTSNEDLTRLIAEAVTALGGVYSNRTKAKFFDHSGEGSL